MPALPCPLGTGCDKGPDGTIWKTIDVQFENAQKLVEDHVKFAHQAVAANAGAAIMKAEKLVRPTLKLHDDLFICIHYDNISVLMINDRKCVAI